MKIRTEKNRIEIEYGDDEKELIGNNIMLVQLGADCISLMEPQGLLEVSKNMIKGVLVDDERLKELAIAIYNEEVVGRTIPIYTEKRYGDKIPEGFVEIV